jgi:hypothetical protein
MDIIREHLIYKDIPIHICFGKLKSIEHYECIRLLLATRTKDVLICKHNINNKYIQELLKMLNLNLKDCSEV